MRNLLGGKGANLAEMNLIGVPFLRASPSPPKFVPNIMKRRQDNVVAVLKDDVEKSIAMIENPDELEVRQCGKILCSFPYVRVHVQSMPGMMDTILNLGLNDEVVAGLARKTNNERFRMGFLSPFRPDVWRRGAGYEADQQG